MNLYEELEQLRNFKKQCLLEVKGLEEQKQNELVIAREQIIKKYSELREAKYREICEYNNRIDYFCKIYSAYSSFNAKDIGNIIASLIGTFEGINYIFQDTFCDKDEVENFTFDNDGTSTRSCIKIIVAEEDKADLYSDSSVDLLTKNGKAIVLSIGDTPSDQISFYVANDVNHSLDHCIHFGRFSYVKDFIDELISYKIWKGSEHISYDELENIEINFIASHIKQIEDNYLVVEKQRANQMEQKLNAEKNTRQLRLRRILNGNKN